MIDTILGTKIDMEQTFLKDGSRVPLTRIQAGPCLVTQVKTMEKDGYQAIQLGLGYKKRKRLTKPLSGHLKKVSWPEMKDNDAPRSLREVRMNEGEAEGLEVGEVLTAQRVIAQGDRVNVTGTSKGRGFTGVVKRWGFKGGPKTHGQSDRQRSPGSIGQTTTPGRVYKGKKMAGRSGSSRVTVRNLMVLKVTDNGEVWIKGLVPGARNGLVRITKVGTGKFVGLFEPGKKEEEKPKKESELAQEVQTEKGKAVKQQIKKEEKE